MKTDNKYLARHYADVNRRYFGNRLPKDMVVRFVYTRAGKDDLGSCVVKWNRPLYIEINKRIQWHHMLVDATLIHEMIHVEHPEWDGHGPRFHKRMLQLAAAGAFKTCW